ncbi:hypothetical protein PT2222_90241 [Paraburkholderia tropica]
MSLIYGANFWRAMRRANLAALMLRRCTQIDFHATVRGAAGFGAVVGDRLRVATAFGRHALHLDAARGEVVHDALCTVDRQRLVVRRLAGVIRMADDLRDHFRVLLQRLRNLVEHRRERRLDGVAVRVERHVARDVELERAVRLLGDLRARALGRARELVLDVLPVVAGDAADQRTRASADCRALAAAEDRADGGARAGADAGAERRVGALLGRAAGDERTGDGEDGQAGQDSCVHFQSFLSGVERDGCVRFLWAPIAVRVFKRRAAAATTMTA